MKTRLKWNLIYSISDIDECAVTKGLCSENANCTSLVASHACTCHNGFYGDGVSCYGKYNFRKLLIVTLLLGS